MATFLRIGTRIFVGSWIALLLIVLLKVGLALSGQYSFAWTEELRFLLLPLLTAPGFLAVLAGQRQR